METEVPQNMPTESSINSRAAGLVSLALIFFASLSFTWVYLSETATPPSAVQTASAAEVIEPAPEPLLPTTAFDTITLEAEGAIVVDQTTGQALYELNADTPLPLASLTKVALVLAVGGALPADAIITIPRDTSPYDTTQKLRAGERWRLQDVIDFTLAVSSNTAADILAEEAELPIQQAYLGAPVEGATIWRMNQLMQHLELSHIYFLNATGLDESATQAGAYGSARDVADLFEYAAESSPTTFAATTKESFRLQSLDGVVSTAVNTDEALPDIPGIVLGKTGFTDLAGGNLAIVFEVEGRRVSAVVLGSSQSGRFDDMKKLVATTREVLGEHTR